MFDEYETGFLPPMNSAAAYPPCALHHSWQSLKLLPVPHRPHVVRFTYLEARSLEQKKKAEEKNDRWSGGRSARARKNAPAPLDPTRMHRLPRGRFRSTLVSVGGEGAAAMLEYANVKSSTLRARSSGTTADSVPGAASLVAACDSMGASAGIVTGDMLICGCCR